MDNIIRAVPGTYDATSRTVLVETANGLRHPMFADDVVGMPEDITFRVSMDDDLAQELYSVFVSLVRWSLRAGRTEVSAVRAAVATCRTLGVPDATTALVRRRYVAGTRATAELHTAR